MARTLSGILNLPMVETDSLVEQSAGRTIPEIFRELGEAAFRDLEFQALAGALSHGVSVIALGGGTLLRGDALEMVTGCCRVFTLLAETQDLLARNNGGRPLAASESELRNLLDSRGEHYRGLPCPIDTSRKTPAEVAGEIAGILRREDPARWSP